MPRVPLAMFVEFTPADPAWAFAVALTRLEVLETVMVAVALPLFPGAPVPNVLPPTPLWAFAVAKMIPPLGLVLVRLDNALLLLPPAAPAPAPPAPERASCVRVSVPDVDPLTILVMLEGAPLPPEFVAPEVWAPPWPPYC